MFIADELCLNLGKDGVEVFCFDLHIKLGYVLYDLVIST